MLPIGLQLYSLREQSKTKQDFLATLERVAKMGYKIVEPAGYHDLKPAELRRVVEDLGMTMVSSHSPWAHTPAGLGEIIEDTHALGLDVAVCGYGPDDFKDEDAIKRTADNTNAMREILAKEGITLFQHNHYWEFERLGGRLKYDIYRELCPGMKYEMDCFWSTNLGRENPVDVLKKFAPDTILLHMKDGVCRQQAKNDGMKDGLLDMKVDLLPLGTGDLPIPDLVAVAPAAVRALIVELDYCAEEMFSAVEKSYRYLTANGLAEGNA